MTFETTVPAWDRLKNFKIIALSAAHRVYRNGYQQLPVRVYVEVENPVTHASVALTQAELDSIVLIEPLGGVELVRDASWAPATTWQYSELKDSRFLEPTFIDGPVPDVMPTGPYVYTKDFYIRTGSRSGITVQPRITRADGKTFQMGEWDSTYRTLRLQPVDPIVYRADQYSLPAASYDNFSQIGDIRKVTVFKLNLIVDQRQIGFVSGSDMPAHLRVTSSNREYSGYYLVGYEHGRRMRTGGIVQWDMPDVWGRSASLPSSVVFVLVYGRRGGRVDVRTPTPDTVVNVRDSYGNSQRLTLRLTESAGEPDVSIIFARGPDDE
ncbi:hypothetical protein J3P95_24170 [Pseudomonas sp. Z5-35]|uniref:hypothetical protein n=1 Tax=unclassified Pseudomonas TaxID=196821 RepID=UPI003DAA3C9E